MVLAWILPLRDLLNGRIRSSYIHVFLYPANFKSYPHIWKYTYVPSQLQLDFLSGIHLYGWTTRSTLRHWCIEQSYGLCWRGRGWEDSIPRSGRSPGGGNGNPTPVFLPGKFHGQRNLVGSSPWRCRVGHDWLAEHTCIRDIKQDLFLNYCNWDNSSIAF